MPRGGRMKPPPGWKPGKGPKGSVWLGRTTITDAVYPPRRPEPSSPEPSSPEPSNPEPVEETPSTTPDLAPSQPDKDGYIPMAEGGTIIGAIESTGTEMEEAIGYLDGLMDAIYDPR